MNESREDIQEMARYLYSSLLQKSAEHREGTWHQKIPFVPYHLTACEAEKRTWEDLPDRVVVISVTPSQPLYSSWDEGPYDDNRHIVTCFRDATNPQAPILETKIFCLFYQHLSPSVWEKLDGGVSPESDPSCTEERP